MKKLLLTIAAVSVIHFADAQVTTNAGTFNKPTKGDFIAEVGFTPSIEGVGSIFTLNNLSENYNPTYGVKFRKFISDNKSRRFTLGVNTFAFKDPNSDNKTTSNSFGIAYGVEKHLKGAERLSTYWGFEGFATRSMYKFESTKGNPNTQKTTQNAFGANIFMGADYYIIPNVYLGLEVAYSISFNQLKEPDNDKDNSFKANNYVNPVFRFGWKF